MSETTNRVSRELRESAVRLVFGSDGQHEARWQTVMSISVRTFCAPEALTDWIEKAEACSGRRIGIPADIVANRKALERGNRELRQSEEGQTIAWWTAFPVNEVLRKASACFATIEGSSGIASNAA
ncbi:MULTISPECIES: hypothetical protein [Paracoccus]|uniref:hypothetical protein n=1 Tax=Paracoccus TaxID=265 RepID=UPI00086F05DF|nr:MULTISPECIES: hypothetical protein [Paracoccus]ODT60765.1 MAG: transposase [Paracoccus sp. SCN 68-21]